MQSTEKKLDWQKNLAMVKDITSLCNLPANNYVMVKGWFADGWTDLNEKYKWRILFYCKVMEQKSDVRFRAEKEYKNSREKFFLLLRN